ncbi:MAG: hypothetical protein HQ522_16680 [Bacteroidetes bacterium]|nr:hypothetical protein [Bacteroidota bacterium]
MKQQENIGNLVLATGKLKDTIDSEVIQRKESFMEMKQQLMDESKSLQSQINSLSIKIFKIAAIISISLPILFYIITEIIKKYVL